LLGTSTASDPSLKDKQTGGKSPPWDETMSVDVFGPEKQWRSLMVSTVSFRTWVAFAVASFMNVACAAKQPRINLKTTA
jgi:hypothetical protein